MSEDAFGRKLVASLAVLALVLSAALAVVTAVRRPHVEIVHATAERAS